VRVKLPIYNISIFRNVTMNPPLVQQMYVNNNALRKKNTKKVMKNRKSDWYRKLETDLVDKGCLVHACNPST
jgi:hypothetical protein